MLAYFDSFVGLVPCRAVRVLGDGRVEVRVTAKRGPYARGDLVEARARCVRGSYGRRWIVGAYDWEELLAS